MSNLGNDVMNDFCLVEGIGDRLKTKPDCVIINFCVVKGNNTKFHSFIIPPELIVRIFLYQVNEDLINMIE